VVVVEALLLAEFGSLSVAFAKAVFVIVPALEGLISIVIVASAPLVSVPI
jgi:hypothetical protein